MKSTVTREISDKIPTSDGDLEIAVKIRAPYGLPIERICDQFAEMISDLHNPNQVKMSFRPQPEQDDEG